MSQRLKMRLKVEPGSIVRVLVAMNKRGFEPAAIVAKKQADLYHVEFELDESKPTVQLLRALERLFDVESVEVVS